MPKLPRRPRSIPRSLDALPEVLAGQRVVATVDPHQADLFAPAFIEPCKPVLSARVPAGERWQYEIKHDGYRAQVHVTDGEVRIFTKSGLDWTDRILGIAGFRYGPARLPDTAYLLSRRHPRAGS